MLSGTLRSAMVVASGLLMVPAASWAQDADTPTSQVGTSSQASPAPQRADGAATEPTAVVPTETGGSQVRIVRLSEVRGVVQMDRNTGRGYEAAFANIPVVAGAKLRTGEGVGEVEFEDNSSLRLTPGSEVVFRQLGRSSTGATETTVEVLKGTVYAGLSKTKGNQFLLTDHNARLVLSPGVHLRLDTTSPMAELAVFDGTAQVEMGSTTTTVGKKQTLSLDPSTQTMAAVAKGTPQADWDEWDKQENSYHNQKASLTNVGGFGLYGANDLNYYGSFVNMPGCGSMWRPYFADAAWDPFANGTWAYYPSAGYSWVSPYPWGWLPFHSGTWASCGGAGWGWRPGGSWYGLGNGGTLRAANRPIAHPFPVAPGRGPATFIPVNTHPLAMSGVSRNEAAFSFRQNSAGLGVPRSSFGNLHGVSGNVERHGVVTSGIPMNGLSTAPGMAQQRGSMAIAPGGARPTSGHMNAPSAMHTSSPSGPVSTMSAVHGGGGASAAPAGGGGAHR